MPPCLPKLPETLSAWKTDLFEETLRREIFSLQSDQLPLEKCISQGSYVDQRNIALSLFSATDCGQDLRLSIGIFFTELVASCGCGEEPMPISAFCKLQVRINKTTANTVFNLTVD